MRGQVDSERYPVVAVETYLQVSRNHNDRSRLPENRGRLQEVMHSKRTRATKGLDQYAEWRA
jgi:hypothetical protein